MRKSSFLVLLIIFSLFSPLGGFLPGRRSHAQTKSSKPSGNKLAESLRGQQLHRWQRHCRFGTWCLSEEFCWLRS